MQPRGFPFAFIIVAAVNKENRTSNIGLLAYILDKHLDKSILMIGTGK
jgi:hypothetical protein